MTDNVLIEPMTEDFILWRCLHNGPLTQESIDQWPSDDKKAFDHFRERNTSLLRKITGIYGACAIIARDGEEIIGQLRFYPKAICDLNKAGGICLQQDHPAGPSMEFIDSDFPPPSQIMDKTLVIHCMMTGSSLQKENPYQRRGIGTRMVRTLIEWAKTHGWEQIETDSFEDLPIIYEITGSAGQTFWKKLGFQLIDRQTHPELKDRSRHSEFITTLEEQAFAMGITPERARHRLLMRLELKNL